MNEGTYNVMNYHKMQQITQKTAVGKYSYGVCTKLKTVRTNYAKKTPQGQNGIIIPDTKKYSKIPAYEARSGDCR